MTASGGRRGGSARASRRVIRRGPTEARVLAVRVVPGLDRRLVLDRPVIDLRWTVLATIVATVLAGCSSDATAPEELARINEAVAFQGPSDTSYAGTVEVQFFQDARIIDVRPIIEGDADAEILGWTDCSRGCAGMMSYADPDTKPLAEGSVTVTTPFDVPDVLDELGTISAVLLLHPHDRMSQAPACIRVIGFEFHTEDGRTTQVMPQGAAPMAVGLNVDRVSDECQGVL